MVIQSNMSPESIVEVWNVTAEVFQKYKIPLTKQTLESLVEKAQITTLFQELNSSIGSSTSTCIEGG